MTVLGDSVTPGSLAPPCRGRARSVGRRRDADAGRGRRAASGSRAARRATHLDSPRAGPGRADWRRPDDRRRLGRRGRATTGGARRRRAGARRAGARVPRVAGRRPHVRRQHRLRALRLRVDPARAGGRAPASASSQPRLRRRRALPGRRRPRGDAAPREHAREGLLRRAGGDGRAARRGARRRPRPACPVAWLGRGERRSRTARASRAAAGRRGRGDRRRRAPRGRRGPARGRSRADRPGSEGRALAHQRDAVHDRDGVARAHAGDNASRASPTSPARCRSRRSRARRRASIPSIHAARPLPGQTRSAATLRALLAGSAIVESHRWCDKVQDAYSLRCAPQVHGASRDLLDYVERTVGGRAQRGHRQPARPARGRADRVERQLPRPAGRDGARLPRDRVRGAREHQRAPDRAARQPVPLRTGCRRSSSRARRGSTPAS